MNQVKPPKRMDRSRDEHQLILLSAGTVARRQERHAETQRLLNAIDWRQLTETLRTRKLLPVLGPRILDLSEGVASTEFRAAVDHALETGRRQGTFLQLISVRVMSMLADAGIRCTPLKGPLLGEAIYGDLGRRFSSDIDLLVAPEQLRAAVEVVRELGYDAPTDYVESDGLPRLHFALVHERGELPPVELHWRVHWYEREFACERLLPPKVPPPTEWHLAPADELATILLFYARDGFIDLRLAADVSAWWDVYRTELPPGALDGLLQAYPALTRVIQGAAKVAEHIVGVPAAHIISTMPKFGLRDRMAVRLANPNPHSSQSQLYADMGLIDGLLAPRGGFRAFMRRQVVPPRDVRHEHALRTPRRRPRSSLTRAAGVLARYGLTMLRLIRSPAASR